MCHTAASPAQRRCSSSNMLAHETPLLCPRASRTRETRLYRGAKKHPKGSLNRHEPHHDVCCVCCSVASSSVYERVPTEGICILLASSAGLDATKPRIAASLSSALQLPTCSLPNTAITSLFYFSSCQAYEVSLGGSSLRSKIYAVVQGGGVTISRQQVLLGQALVHPLQRLNTSRLHSASPQEERTAACTCTR